MYIKKDVIFNTGLMINVWKIFLRDLWNEGSPFFTVTTRGYIDQNNSPLATFKLEWSFNDFPVIEDGDSVSVSLTKCYNKILTCTGVTCRLDMGIEQVVVDFTDGEIIN